MRNMSTRKMKIMIGSIAAVLLVTTFIISVNTNISSKASVAITYKYAKDETLLRKEANSSAEVSLVIVKGTKMKYISSVTKGDGTIYDKVEIVKDNNYAKGHVGYVLRRQTSTSEVEPHTADSRLMYIKNKTAMVRTAMAILNTDTKYNMKAPYRVGGYYNVKQEGKYVYDCSAFCSTLMNRVFGLDMTLQDKEKLTIGNNSYDNVWTTYTYMEEANKSDGMFKVIDKVTGYGESIDKKKLQIGDLIVGDAKNIKNGVNHIMFYVGDGYIIHASGSSVIRERLDRDYYTRLESKENVASGKYTQRFDKSIQILRYRDREVNDRFIKYQYAKDETLLRKKASSSSEVEVVIVKGTKMKYISSITRNDGTIYDKVEIVADNNYEEGHVGYVLRRQTTTSQVKADSRLMYIKNKTAMVKNAMAIMNTDTKYNLNKPYRVGGYYNVKQDGKYVYDCSTFCSTLMNRVFGLDMILKDKDKVTLGNKSYYNVWTTNTYINEANKADGMFKVVDKVTGYGEAIDKTKLQIGDFIIGYAKNINNGINHIMFYSGDDYIIHARGTGVVRERLETDYYTRLESKENMISGKYTQRFDKSIQILRYRDRELNEK